MSDTEEDKRAKQLEEARKRVEELKNKKNKNKNKKKKNKDKEGDDKAAAVEANDSANEITEATETADSTEALEVPDSKEATPAEEVKQTEDEEIETKDDDLQEESVVADTKEESIPTEEAKVVDEAQKTIEDVEELTREVETKLQGDINEKKAAEEEYTDKKEEPKAQDGLDDMFGNDDNSNDFISTINKEKEADEISELKKEIEKLIAENKTLKFANIDHETVIEELQEENAKYKEMLELTQNDLQQVKNELLQTQVKLNEVSQNNNKPVNASPTLQFAKFNSNSETSNYAPSNSTGQTPKLNTYGIAQTQTVDRAMLQKWRNWNIDMTTWRSIGSGPIVEF